MSVDTTTRKVSYTCSAVANYDFTFRALTSAPTDIKCKLTVIATGVETNLAYTTGYTVAINSNGIGGTVTLVTTYGTTHKLTIYRETTDLQSSDYNDYNQFPADTLETDLDRRTMKSQEVAEDVARSLKVSVASTITSISIPDPTVEGSALIWSAGTIKNSTVNIESFDSSVTACVAAATTATNAMTSAVAAATSATTTAAAIRQHIRATLPLPNDYFVNVSRAICLVSSLDAAITITNILCTSEIDPGTESTITLFYANSFIGTASPVYLSSTTTVAGVYTSGTVALTVPTTKCLYVQLGATPDTNIKQLHWDIKFNY
jgi:hypothetical protein